MKSIYLLLLACMPYYLFAQNVREMETPIEADEEISYGNDEEERTLSISAYAEVYYAYDLNRPANHSRPPFVYAYNRTEEVNVNLAFLRASYNKKRIRANVGVMAGTYANANLAAEPGVLKNIYEANAGLKLSRNSELWLDAGIMPSHIGFESAIGMLCPTLTRSMMADNSPYYEAGAKLSYTTKSGKLYLALLYLNGWQRIQRPYGNHTPAFGTQVKVIGEDMTFNYSTFFGNDYPDSIRRMRFFNDFYLTATISKKFDIVAAVDVGIEQAATNSSTYNYWYSPNLIVRYKMSRLSSLSARVEYYSDENGVIIPTATPNGFKTWGYSLNYDVKVLPVAIWRIEGKLYMSEDDIFFNETEFVNTSPVITTSLAVSF